MRHVLAALLLVAIAVPITIHAQSAPAASDRPFVVEYYYKTKWGHADEFLKLFKKNHYPVLKKEAEMGRITQSPTSPSTRPRCKSRCILTRIPSSAKSSAASKFSMLTGICR
jgi:hypothetical protein